MIHSDRIATNHWVRTARKYFVDWQINVYPEPDAHLVFTHRYACRQRRVYIAFESKALGDTLAWFGAVEAFHEAQGCHLICSTFHNDLFRKAHPSIDFVEPGTVVENLYAMYQVGWFRRDDGSLDLDRNVRDVLAQPLGETASDILGVPYVERRPRIRVTSTARPADRPYVCIGVHATAQAKYWNNPDGWSEVVAFLIDRGYEVRLLSREGMHYMGNTAPAGVVPLRPGPIDEAVRQLQHAALFIGVGSGLSWLAWAAGCPTCLISGFSLPYSEMADCIRVLPPAGVCSGCFNRVALDQGDWRWCPDHAGTARQFECSRAIIPEQVIEAIAPQLQILTEPAAPICR